MANKNLPSFQLYQRTFTQHLRDSTKAPPVGVVKKRMAVYQEIVFNNLFQSVSSCFPVAQQVIGKRRWQTLVRKFFSSHSSNSPFFRNIPADFLTFLSEIKEKESFELPEYFISLCHYEWVELALATDETSDLIDMTPMQLTSDLLDFNPIFISSMKVLAYEYPVHQISAKKQPKTKTPTFLLVYRNAAFSVKFIVLNAVTYRLINILREENMTGEAALTQIAKELQHSNPVEIIQFGLTILEDFRQQGLIIGVTPTKSNQN